VKLLVNLITFYFQFIANNKFIGIVILVNRFFYRLWE